MINSAEAEVVRHILQRYLEADSARVLAAEFAQAGIRSKAWITRDGKPKGGVVMKRGALFHILSSRIYRGEIVHKGLVHPGQIPYGCEANSLSSAIGNSGWPPCKNAAISEL